MSTKRSTRAASRASTSPAPTDITTTPGGRRTTRNKKDGLSMLPSVGTKESTSYGSKAGARPVMLNQGGNGEGLDDHLSGIMKPARDNHDARQELDDAESIEGSIVNASQVSVRGRRGNIAASTTPRATRTKSSRAASVVSTPGNTSLSYGDEGALMGETTFTTPNPFGARVNNTFDTIEEEPDEASTTERFFTRNFVEQSENIHRIRNAVGDDSQPSFLSYIVTRSRDNVNLFCRTLSYYAAQVVGWIKDHLWLSVLLLSILALATQPSQDLKDHINGLIPSTVTHRLNYFTDNDVADLQKRVISIEKDIQALKKRNRLDGQTLKHLENILPEFVLFKKDKLGKKQIPSDFWRALKEKIQDESPILKDYFIHDGELHPGAGELSEAHVKKIAKSAWSVFLDQNEARIKAWQTEVFNDEWDEHIKASLKDDVLVSKADIVETVKEHWADSQKIIKAEIGKIGRELDRKLQAQGPQGHQQHRRADGVAMTEVKKIARATFEDMIPALQLEALAQVKVDQNTFDGLRRINHFSPGNGAIVNPHVTSPTFALPAERSSFFGRQLLSVLGFGPPRPNPPSQALSKWEEAGDCWCSPSEGTGSGVQLGVLLSHDISPDEVIIEHIPFSATLDPGAAPRQFELLAKIEGWDSQGAVSKLSEQMFPGIPGENELDESWIKIARFTYDPTDVNYRQSFGVAVNLESLNTYTRQLIIRAVSNHGADHTCIYRVRVHGDVRV